MACASIQRTAGNILRSKSLNTVSFMPSHDVTPNILRQPPKLRTPSTFASTQVAVGSVPRRKLASTVSSVPSHDTTPDILPPVPNQREHFDPLTSRSQLPGPPFKQGGREVFLPYFVVAMIKTSMPPNYAKFLVPLTFNKLDLRDYLYNVYGVNCFNIRVYVEQQRARIGKPVPFGERRMWFRPRARKFMTVELDKPFVWPDAPENTADWDKEDKERYDNFQEEGQMRQGNGLVGPEPNDRESLEEQARALLSGKQKWRPTWQDIEGDTSPASQ